MIIDHKDDFYSELERMAMFGELKCVTYSFRLGRRMLAVVSKTALPIQCITGLEHEHTHNLIEFKHVPDIHAKFYVNPKQAIIGSMNLSESGHYNMSVLTKSPFEVKRLNQVFKTLWLQGLKSKPWNTSL